MYHNGGFPPIFEGGKKETIQREFSASNILPLSQIFMKREQFYRIKNEGLPHPQNDIYNISEKTDIIVKITLL